MATRTERKRLVRYGLIAVGIVVAWDLVKSHTGIARPQGNGVNGKF